jgi:RNA polymerase sigma factor (sigma-70 family)
MNADDPLFTRQTLLRRVRRQRDQAAWEEFAGYYRGYIHNIACRMGLGHHDAQEIGQNVMLQLWKKLPDFEYDAEKGRFRSWLCTVAGNEVKMLLRRRSKDPDALSSEERENLGRALERAQSDPGEEFAEREWAIYVTSLAWKRIEERVGEKERAAFEMISKGQAVEEVARSLGIAPASVYVYKKRVKDLLTREIVALNNDLD